MAPATTLLLVAGMAYKDSLSGLKWSRRRNKPNLLSFCFALKHVEVTHLIWISGGIFLFLATLLGVLVSISEIKMMIDSYQSTVLSMSPSSSITALLD